MTKNKDIPVAKVIDNNELGNPLLVASTAKNIAKRAANSNAVKNIAGSGVKIIGVAVITYAGYKGYKSWRIASVKKKAFENPDIKAAMDIYDAIPAGLKKGKGGFLNPFGFIADAGNTIARIWQDTDTERLMKIAPKIKNMKKVAGYFQLMYGESLYALLNNALDKRQLNMFLNYAKSKGQSASETEIIKAGRWAICKKSSGVHVRSTPVVDNGRFNTGIGSNSMGVCPYNRVAGISTGREKISDDGKTIFVEIKIYDKRTKKFSKIAYAWKGGFDFKTSSEIKKVHGKLSKLIHFFEID